MEQICILVPVYNAIQWIDGCIRSVINQTYRHWHLVLVNDGSTDGSAEIMRNYAESDSRITVVSRPNGGFSAARNTALENMGEAEYVCFLDSDDTLPDTALEVMLAAAHTSGAPLVSGVYTSGEVSTSGTRVRGLRVISADDAICRVLTQRGFDNSLWAKLFRADLLRDITFKDGIAYEDLEIFHRIYQRAGTICRISNTVYRYRQHADSFMRSDLPAHFDIIDVTAGIERLAAESGDKTMLQAARDRSFSAAANLYRRLVRGTLTPARGYDADAMWQILTERAAEIPLGHGHRLKNRLGATAALAGRRMFTLLCRLI